MKCPTCRVRMVPHTDLTATVWICPRCEHEERQEKEPRHPTVIAGAMAEIVDRNLRLAQISGLTCVEFPRLRELLDELGHALLLQQLMASVHHLQGEKTDE